MVNRRLVSIGAFLMVLFGLLASVFVSIYNHKNASSLAERTGSVGPASDLSYLKLRPIIDPEHRAKSLDASMGNDAFDLTAMVGLPEEYKEVLLSYTQAVSEAIQATPLTRRRFYHKKRPPEKTAAPINYPDDANPVYDRDIVVPLVLLPRPEAVRTWSASKEARALGWRSEDGVTETRGSVYGQTIVFKTGKRSKEPWAFPASPFETGIPSWYLYTMESDSAYFLFLGKVVLRPYYEPYNHGIHEDQSAVLHLGEQDGALLLGEFITIPTYLQNNRLRWVSIGYGSNARRFLAYSLIDGNGARRIKFANGVMWTSDKISPYVRPLTCEQHQPKIKQHDELLLPTPLGWPPTREAWAKSHGDDNAHEEWCLDDWFPAQKDACWVIREAEDSKPLQESFLLMPASEESDRPVFFIALFAETEPKQLVKELATLYKVSPDAALNSPETMQRLNSLYEKVRDFPLTK